MRNIDNMFDNLNRISDINSYIQDSNEKYGVVNIQLENKKMLEKFNAEQKQREEAMLNTLIRIEENTANLNTIVELVKNSTIDQKEILNIINQLLLISKEKDKKEAESKYKKVMGKIATLGENADTMNKLYTFGSTVYAILKANNIL